MTHQLIARGIMSVFLMLACGILIKRGIAGPYEATFHYGASDVLSGCVLLAIIYMSWF